MVRQAGVIKIGKNFTLLVYIL